VPDVSRIQGDVSITGLDQAVTGLNTLASVFDKAGASSTAAARQINQFGTLGQSTQTAATGVNALANANQQYTQAARARVTADEQLEKVQLRLRLAQTDASGRVAILRQQYEQLAAAARPLALSQDELTKRTIAATQAAIQLANAERAVAREQQSHLATAASGVGRGVLQGIGAGGVLGGLGIAGGIAVATRSLIDLGTETADLAIKAQTIGTAYEAATKRAGFGADDLLKKLDAAARGTASDTDLMAASNRALALGVGQNAQQIADLLAIARQKGKDFGESTTQAFEDITTGLGRLSPRILDNLGIILDENKIYIEYAKSIGVAEGKLSDQEKRQALVNDLIKNNTDLISKNAQANLDAADKIANAAAREQAAKERLGQASLPLRTGFEQGLASFFEALTGKPQEDARKQVEALALSASSYEDYVKRINAARDHLQAGLNVIPAQFTLQLTPEQFDQLRELERLSHMAGMTKDDFAGLPPVLQANGHAAALTKEDYDRIGTSLQIATEQGLKPFKAAVDAAKTSLDAQKASTAAAKDTVDSIKESLDKAKTSYKEFATARLVEDQKYQQQLFDLDQQSAIAERKLLEFKAPGAGLDQAINPIKAQIDAADASLKGYASDLDEINSFVEDQTRTVKEAEAAQKGYDRAVADASDNLSAQQSRLDALQGVYDNLGEAIQSAKRDMDDLRHTALVGEGALDDRLFKMEQGIKAQQLRIDQAKLGGAGKDEIKKLTEQLDKLRTAEDAARLAGELRYDKQHRALEQQGVPRNEQTFDQASHDLGQYQQGVEQLTEAQKQAGDAVEAQKQAISDAKFDLMDATAVQRDHTKAVEAEKATLDGLKETQATISKQYQDQKTLLADLKQQLDTTTKDALKPFQDQIDEIARQASLAKIAEKLEIDPLKKKIEETTASTKLLTFQEIIDGISHTNDVIAILEPRLTAAQNVLKKEQDATKVLQDVYDGTTKALDAQQKYFDNLKQGLDALKANLQGSKDIWGDLSTLIGAINAANGIGNTGGFPGQRAPYTPGSGGYNPNAINSELNKAGSPLTGQGQFIIEMSQKYGIPVEIALAMWKVEGNYGTAGASVANKNPGNLRASPFAAGTNGGFALFDSWQAGIEGFFKLLSENTFGYKTDVDKYKGGDLSALLDLIKNYAPVGDNNNPQTYYDSVVKMIAQLLKVITGGGGAPGRAGVINNGTTVDDPMPSMASVTQLFGSGARIGDTYDALRPGTTGIHYGVDIIMDPGTPLRSPVAGLVIAAGAGSKSFQGGIVMVVDVLGRQWYFGHLHNIQVKVNQQITKGTLLAYIGSEGHVHVQVRQHNDSATPIDPSSAIDQAAGVPYGGPSGTGSAYAGEATGAGDVFLPQTMYSNDPRWPLIATTIAKRMSGAVSSVDLSTIVAYIGALHDLGDATAAAADGLDVMVNATDEILDHATYKNRDGSGLLAYLNQNGGLSAGAGNWTRTAGGGMSVGGPHYGDPIVTPPKSMQGNDPTWGDLITATAGAATSATKDVGDAAEKWTGAWHDMGDATVAEMQRADDFMRGASANIIAYINTALQRLDDLIGKILSVPGVHVSTGPSQREPGGVNEPGQPGGTPAAPGPTFNQYNNITTRDSDRAMRLLRQQGHGS
jgi:hypothetical protein